MRLFFFKSIQTINKTQSFPISLRKNRLKSATRIKKPVGHKMLAKFQNRLLLLFSSFLTAKHAPDMKLSEGRVFGGSLKACRGIGDHKISLHLKMIFGVFLPMLSPAGRRIIAFYLFYLSAHDSPTRGHKSKFHFNVLTKDQIKHFN